MRFGNFKMPSKSVWNSKLGEGQGVKGEYQDVPQLGYDEYLSNLRLRAIFVSIFSPCIPILRNSRAFEITSFISTAYYLITIIIGWVLCEIHPEFGFVPADNSTLNLTNIHQNKPSLGDKNLGP